MGILKEMNIISKIVHNKDLELKKEKIYFKDNHIECLNIVSSLDELYNLNNIECLNIFANLRYVILIRSRIKTSSFSYVSLIKKDINFNNIEVNYTEEDIKFKNILKNLQKDEFNSYYFDKITYQDFYFVNEYLQDNNLKFLIIDIEN